MIILILVYPGLEYLLKDKLISYKIKKEIIFLDCEITKNKNILEENYLINLENIKKTNSFLIIIGHLKYNLSFFDKVYFLKIKKNIIYNNLKKRNYSSLKIKNNINSINFSFLENNIPKSNQFNSFLKLSLLIKQLYLKFNSI